MIEINVLLTFVFTRFPLCERPAIVAVIAAIPFNQSTDFSTCTLYRRRRSTPNKLHVIDRKMDGLTAISIVSFASVPALWATFPKNQ